MEYVNDGGEAGESLARTWIFQANPKTYNIDGALQKLKEITWSVTRYKNEIQPGDRVFLWRSGGEAGIVADGTVMTAPDEMEIPGEDRGFVKNRRTPLRRQRLLWG